MTRMELLQHLIHQARGNGFQFRRWFRTSAAHPWTTSEDALEWLCKGSRFLLLLFSHDFARAFFHSGEKLRYVLPQVIYERVLQNGRTQTIRRRAHTRQSSRKDVWRYHLQEMAGASDPLRYIRRYLLLEETIAEQNAPPPPPSDAPDYDDELLVREETGNPDTATPNAARKSQPLPRSLRNRRSQF